MFLENKLPLQDILVTMNIPICNIVNYISDDEMIAGCTDRIGNGERYILEDWCWRVLEEYERIYLTVISVKYKLKLYNDKSVVINGRWIDE